MTSLLKCRVIQLFCLLINRSYEENPEEAIKSCQLLLEEPDLETAVRIGDVYGLIIEYFARQQNHSKVWFANWYVVCFGVARQGVICGVAIVDVYRH